MAILIIEQGPEAGQQFTLDSPQTVLGRQSDCRVCLSAKAVSRQHAQILEREGQYYLEDLSSSNGTYVNGKRLKPHAPLQLSEQDRVQIGPYVLALYPEPTPMPTERSMVIRDQISAVALDQSVYGQAPAQKLQVILEISQHLARTLELEPLLEKLLDQIMRLFPYADRCMVLLLEGENLIVRGQRCRHAEEPSTYHYSRTVVQQALAEGMGILSEDVQDDTRFDSSATLASLNLHSLLCVPLICQDGRRLGVIQVDRFRRGHSFRSEDLQMLTTICLQVAVVLDNAHLHSQLLKEERFRQELQMAREIQQGFLPSDFDEYTHDGFELFACVHPAREVSGDLYDLSRLEDGRIAFFIGDVAGKGMPAALLMVVVHTLGRHLLATTNTPAQTLNKLNDSLSKDNPSGKFVTLEHGIYDPKTGEVALASGGHPLPILRRANGEIEDISARPGRPLGYEGLPINVTDIRVPLGAGDTLVFFTDGLLESRLPHSRELFGMERIKDLVRRFEATLPLPDCAELARNTIEEYTKSRDLQDDLTLLLLRRRVK